MLLSTISASTKNSERLERVRVIKTGEHTRISLDRSPLHCKREMFYFGKRSGHPLVLLFTHSVFPIFQKKVEETLNYYEDGLRLGFSPKNFTRRKGSLVSLVFDSSFTLNYIKKAGILTQE